MKVLLIIAVALSIQARAADVYKCTDENGRSEFSQRPCSEDAEEITIDGPALSGSVKTDSEALTTIRNNNRSRDITRQVAEHRREIDRLQKRMQQEMNVLKKRQGYARNNLAGATWQQSLATEMQSVSDKYSVMIDLERDKISRLDEEMKGL